MTNKQIHELPAAEPAGARRTSSSSRRPAATLTRRASLGNLPFQPALPGTSRRTIAGKLGEMVSVKDFGAVGDGSVDDSAAFQAALDQHTAIHVPAGTYRLDGEIQVKPRRRLFGAGRDVTVIDARGPRAFTFQRNEGAYRSTATPAATGAAARCPACASHGHGRHPGPRPRVPRPPPAVLRRCRRRRASPMPTAGASTWSTPTSATLRGIQAGYGGGGSHRTARQRHPLALDPAGGQLRRQPAGRDLDQAGGRATPAACSSRATTGLINNVLLERVQVNAPAAAGTDAVQVPGSSPPIYTLGRHRRRPPQDGPPQPAQHGRRRGGGDRVQGGGHRASTAARGPPPTSPT